MGALRYSGPFVFLASIPLLFRVSDAAPLLTPAALFALLLAADLLNGPKKAPKPSPIFEWLPIVYIPLQLAVTVWAVHRAATPDVSAIAFASLAATTGICTGVFGVLAAHETIHGRIRWRRFLGEAMLTAMSYRHFRIAHIYGHHRFAATGHDASTARQGEGFYAFFARTLPAQFIEAWRFERRRCRTRALSQMRNRVFQDVLLTGGIYAALLLFWGWQAAIFLSLESALAVLVLELFNYIAHYGLSRRIRNGKPEPLSDRHSWNSSGLGNLLIFNMGRHSRHHRAASGSYERLESADAPELPMGYAGSIALALIPPLWRAVMDPRVRSLEAQQAELGYDMANRPMPATS